MAQKKGGEVLITEETRGKESDHIHSSGIVTEIKPGVGVHKGRWETKKIGFGMIKGR